MICENTGAATVPPKIGVGPVEDDDHGQGRVRGRGEADEGRHVGTR